MGEETKKNTNWGTISGIVFLLAIAIGLVYYYVTSLWIPAIGIPLLIIGVYEVLSAFFRSSEKDRWGTSESGAAVLWGFVLIAAGGAIMVYQYADSIIIPIVFVIIVMVLYLFARSASKGKN